MKNALGHPPPITGLGLRARGGWRFFRGSGGCHLGRFGRPDITPPSVLWVSLVARVLDGFVFPSGWRFFQCVAVRRGLAFPFLLAWSAAAFSTPSPF